jgi:hypothetical protein
MSNRKDRPMGQYLVVVLAVLLNTALAEADLAQGFLDNLNVVEGRTYGVKVVAPLENSMTPQQRKAVEEIKKTLDGSFSGLLSNVGRALTDQSETKKLFLNSIQQIQKDVLVNLGPSIKELEDNDPLLITTYFLPWKEIEDETEEFFGLFPVQHQQGLGYIVTQIAQAVQAAQEASRDQESPFYFIGIATQVKIQKERSRISLQILGGLKPGDYDFAKSNDQLRLTHLRVPAIEGENAQSAVLISLSQDLDRPTAIPRMTVNFGPYDGIYQGLHGRYYLFEIRQSTYGSPDICKIRSKYVPKFVGRFAEQATENRWASKFLSDRPVQFHIMYLSFNVEANQVNHLDLRMDLDIKGLRCLSRADVNEQFSSEINKAINEKINSLYQQDDITDELIDYLINVRDEIDDAVAVPTTFGTASINIRSAKSNRHRFKF